MQKLTREKALELRKAAVGRPCPITGKVIVELKDAVIDHSHKTGEVRGVLSRWGNAQLGKAENAANRSKGEQSIEQTLENMLAWLRKPGVGLMYPTHKTDADKKEAAAAKRKKAAAARARAVMTKGK